MHSGLAPREEVSLKCSSVGGAVEVENLPTYPERSSASASFLRRVCASREGNAVIMEWGALGVVDSVVYYLSTGHRVQQ